VHGGEAAAIRFAVPESGEISFHDVVRGPVSFNLDVIGDPIVVRSDGRPSYNFAVVVDDALMRVTHVIRGEDHISNTPRQLLLYRALHFTPPRFAHLSLVLGPDHAPLSKRHGATSVAEFRARGYLPEALVNYLALLGWSPGGGEELLDLAEMARRFSLEDVGLSAGVFDHEKLAWVNRHYLKLADPGRIAMVALPYFQQAGFVTQPSDAGFSFLIDVVPMGMTSVDRIEEIPARVSFLFDWSVERAMRDQEIRQVIAEPGAAAVIGALAEELATEGRLVDRDRFRAVAARVRGRTGQKGRGLFHPIRVALTGHAGGPELDQAVPAIDRGAELPPGSGVSAIAGCRERAAAFAAAVDH
jgi:glutamyl-tRNA synthetase